MLRAFLVAVCLALLTLIVIGSRPSTAPAPVVQVAPLPVPPPPLPVSASPPLIPLLVPIGGSTSAASATPALDMLDRLAIRRRLAREGDRVYLDSLLAHNDSTLTRWTARSTLRVAFIPDTSLARWTPALINEARTAMRAWDLDGAGLTLREVSVPDSADITVAWVRMLDDTSEDGRTALAWGADGVVTHASILLALRAGDSLALPPAVRERVAVHEFGHALGLPHSGRDDDVMYRTSPVNEPSPRDQATLRLLYALPPGPLRIPRQPGQP